MWKKRRNQSTLILWTSLAIATLAALAYSSLDRETLVRLLGLPVMTYKTDWKDLPLNKAVRNPEDNTANRFAFHARLVFVPRFDQPYQNLFQTSTGNDGIRFELGSTGAWALIVGHDGAFASFVVEEEFLAGKQYVLEVWGHDSRVELLVNGRRENRTVGMHKIPRFDEIIFGNGFDKKRPFHGKLDEYEMEIRTYYIGSLRNWASLLLRLAFLILGLVSGAIFSWCLLAEKDPFEVSA